MNILQINQFEARLREFLLAQKSSWSNLDQDLGILIDELLRLVNAGGKRLRPAFCYFAYVGAGGDHDAQQLLDAQCAIELLHLAALIHDDVIDDAALRRGQTTTHQHYFETHQRNFWSTDARRFGEGAAILIGDLAMVYADQLMAKDKVQVVNTWNEMRIELNIGQYLDLLGSVKRERQLLKALRVSRYKSGKYTIERPLHIGVLMAAPDRADELLPQMSQYGLPLGDAFQMRDDVLGAFGETIIGKPIGDDLRQGKPTPLLALACELANPSQRRVLDLVGSFEIEDQTINQIQEVIKQTGALKEVESKIVALTMQATSAISKASISSFAKAGLTELAETLANRRH